MTEQCPLCKHVWFDPQEACVCYYIMCTHCGKIVRESNSDEMTEINDDTLCNECLELSKEEGWYE